MAGITLIGVGIGSLSKEKLKKICSPGKCFVLENYSDLVASIPKANLELQPTYFQTKVPIGWKEPLPLEITIQNNGSPVPKGSKLVVGGGDFYRKSFVLLKEDIPSMESKKYSVTLTLSGRASIDLIPDIVPVFLFLSSSEVLDLKGFRIPFGLPFFFILGQNNFF